VGALAIADLVKTSLGPKGMDKILQSSSRGGAVSVTNDGATILKSVLIDNPAAKVLIDISKVRRKGGTRETGTFLGGVGVGEGVGEGGSD
jgi:chaperonin GroEL (HSP60 family)